MVPMIVNDDVEAAADMLRPMYALYFGGMGAKERELPRERADPYGLRGRGRARSRISTSTARRTRPPPRSRTELIEKLALIGPVDKIRHDLEAWRESLATTLLITGDAALLRTAAELVL